MLKSFCVKTNNMKLIDDLIYELENIGLDGVYISQKKFAIYENIIIHYSGNNVASFEVCLARALANIIIKYYQRLLFKNIINENYFYFFDFEKSDIINKCMKNSCDYKLTGAVYNECLNFIMENKSMVLDGFVRFRLYNYISLLDEIVDFSINEFLVQKEYFEFINLLKDYVITSKPTCCKIHLLYSTNNTILINDDNKIIPIEENISNVKYLSDITFSKNDYCLNTLLTLVPQKIILHLSCPEDEFVETLKLIFADRISICNSCKLCTQAVKKMQ